MNEIEDKYQQKAFETKILMYLQTKADDEPEDLSEVEGGLLLLFNLNKFLNIQERVEKYIEFYEKLIIRAGEFLDSYKAGKYAGKDAMGDFRTILPADIDQYVRMLNDIDLVIKINELNERFMNLYLKNNPLSTIVKLTPSQYQAIEEEKRQLLDAGYPIDKVDAEAHKRGTFKAAFGEGYLPPITPYK